MKNINNFKDFINEKKDDTTIKSKTTTDLIKEAGLKGYKKVKVIFVPAYEEEKHKNITNKELTDSMKKSKEDIYDVIEDTSTIVKLLTSKDVISIKFIK